MREPKDNLPFVDELGINLERPDETGEHLDGPGVAEDILHIGHIHTELVAESLLDIEGNLSEDAVNARDALVGHSDLRKVRVLEETIIRLFFFDSQGHSAVNIGVISARLRQWDLTAGEHLNVTSILILYSSLSILRSGNILDLNARAFVLLTLNREVNIDTKLSIFNLSFGDAKTLKQLLQLTNDQLGIVRVSWLGSGNNLKEGHAGAVVVNEHLIALIDALCRVLFHLDALHQDVILILFEVIEEETAVQHDWVVLLSDLVCLRQVCVHVMLTVELDLWQNATTESQRGLDSQIEALLVQHGKHTGQTQINEICMRVGLLCRGVQRG